MYVCSFFLFFFSSRRRHTRYIGDWSSDVCSSDLLPPRSVHRLRPHGRGRYRCDRSGQQGLSIRSEERRVGKECRSRWWRYHEKKKAEQCWEETSKHVRVV